MLPMGILLWADFAMKYFEKLKDPRWQKRRLEIMEKAEFMCVMCQDNEHTLNVHHFYYERGKDPWEYPDDALWCLCEGCHKEVQGHTTQLLKTLSKTPDELIPWDFFPSFLGLFNRARSNDGDFWNCLCDILINMSCVHDKHKRALIETQTVKYLRAFLKILDMPDAK